MAGRTIGRKLVRRVVGGCRLVEISGMATGTGVRGIVVIAVVAGGTVVGNSCVRTVQRIIIVVVGKRSRRPAGSSGMARSTIRRQAQTTVIWVRSLVKIVRMARSAIRWRARITVGVAGDTICGKMRPG